MLGFLRHRPKPRRVPFADAPPKLFTTLLCDGWTLHNVQTFETLVATLRPLQAEHPDCRLLASLDDLGQSSYTSGHTIDANDLNAIGDRDLATLDPRSLEDGEYRGTLSGPSEFPIRHANLIARACGTGFADICGRLDWACDDDRDPAAANAAPDRALMLEHDKEIVVQRVPVRRAADALAAFPNGYFTGDLSPMQNYALAQHLEDAHGFSLFGVGAAYLGFWRDEPLDQSDAQALAMTMTRLYADCPAGAGDAFARAMLGRDVLIVRYTES
jgi:hypothetical protein